MNTAYHPVSKGLHWLMGVMILGLLSLGTFMSELPLSPQKLQLYSWHKWAGVTVFLLVWIRLAWRVTHRPPAPSAAISPRLQTFARLGHGTLYALMIIIPLSGWLMSSAKGVQPVWFGVLPLPDLLPRDRALGDLLEETHEVLNLLLMVILLIHIAAALWHHFVRKDDTLRRMGWSRDHVSH